MRGHLTRWTVVATACALGLLAGGCAGDTEEPAANGGDDDGAWREIRADRLTPPQRAAVDRGLAARDAMFGALLGRLGEAMAEGGPGPAIDVCRVDAPRIAGEVAEARDLRIGRTSFKLRNPANAAPAWVEPAVLARRATPARYVADDGTIGVLEPIMTLASCLACHGAADQLAPGVPEALAVAYPDDRATGFEAGDLRGWFWMEVEPSAE